MKELIKKYKLILIAIGVLLILICFVLLLISESQMPTIFISSGAVAIISAFLGVFLTVAVTNILLDRQAETQNALLDKQSEKESQKDKDVKIYEKKIRVYSEFTSKMWGILEDDKVTDDELRELRNICFRNLVFYINQNQINRIYEQIVKIDKDNIDTALGAAGEITYILKNSLQEDENVKSSDLKKLFNVFIKDKKENNTDEKDVEQQKDIVILENKQFETPDAVISSVAKNITFWHFNIWGNQQIEAFEKGNWVLNLIEYGEDWRTLKINHQVQPDDVVFLFRRGGYGYIGAFRVLGKKILTDKESHTDEEIEKYDIYGALEDGATYSSNIIVKPMAYNFKGVGYLSVRRRTIEKMNEMNAVYYLLSRFKVNNTILNSDQMEGIGKLESREISTSEIDVEYFNKVFSDYSVDNYLMKKNLIEKLFEELKKSNVNLDKEGISVWLWEHHCLVHDFKQNDNENKLIAIDTYVTDKEWCIEIFDRNNNNPDKIVEYLPEVFKNCKSERTNERGGHILKTYELNTDISEIESFLKKIRETVEVDLKNKQQ